MNSCRRFHRSCAALLALLVTLFAQPVQPAPRDILAEIVDQCVDSHAANYCSRCRWPTTEAACRATAECRETTEVWRASEDYVAIRDIKMCGCPADFVHGLALPRAPVSGVEDPQRPEGIWAFAWGVGRQRLPADSLALTVNPKNARSQDRLHVHIVRLEPTRETLLQANTVAIQRDLGRVWEIAETAAQARGLADYGVLVRQRPDGQFALVVMAASPEDALTAWRCR